MRAFAVVVILAGLGGVYLWQKKGEPTQPAAPPPVAQHTGATSASGTAPVREVSEHNWMKRSLDRTRDVRDQARTQTKESQDP
jgi:hypothetical protein